MNLNIRLSIQQDSVLTKSAKKLGMTKSEYVREVLFANGTCFDFYESSLYQYFAETQKGTKMLLNLILFSIAEQHGNDKAREIADKVKKIIEGDN
ncbi:MAG: hypothetical protein H6Q67_1359 [Firmicutes bacterium]|nr:hypothetical protein [Bacillota bacterium]